MKLPGTIKWHQIAISLLIGFALGIAFGHWHAEKSFPGHWKKEDMKQHMLERFNRDLHLSADQMKQVAVIFDAKHPQMVALHAEIRPKFEALRNETQAEIRKILNPDQQKKFDEMNIKMEKHWNEHKEF
jgi:hypothetical protein